MGTPLRGLVPVCSSIQFRLKNHKGGDFIDAYLAEVKRTHDSTSSFYGEKGIRSLDCVMIDLFIGKIIMKAHIIGPNDHLWFIGSFKKIFRLINNFSHFWGVLLLIAHN